MDFLYTVSNEERRRIFSDSDFLHRFRKHANSVFDHPEIIFLLESKEYQLSDQSGKIHLLQNLCGELGLTFYESHPLEWFKALETALVGGQQLS